MSTGPRSVHDPFDRRDPAGARGSGDPLGHQRRAQIFRRMLEAEQSGQFAKRKVGVDEAVAVQ